jgi:hypoxanthine-DNA glycosylase
VAGIGAKPRAASGVNGMLEMAKRIEKIARARGFPPIAAADARVLVLGSMPGVASLAQGQDYAHPRNAFWPSMGRLFGAGLEASYAERRRILKSQRVAVWDVLRECGRAGSLDSALDAASERANDFVTFFRRHPQIDAVFFNGQKAETAFRRHAMRDVLQLEREIVFQRLPSTSPAHAGRRFDEKLAAWQAVRRALES